MLRVCAATTVKLAADTSVPKDEKPGLLMALDHGAMEADFATGRNSDMVLTPDFRILISGPGKADVKVRLGRQGDTCVDNAGVDAPYVLVSSLFEGGVYRVQPGQRVMFEHGSLRRWWTRRRSRVAARRRRSRARMSFRWRRAKGWRRWRNLFPRRRGRRRRRICRWCITARSMRLSRLRKPRSQRRGTWGTHGRCGCACETACGETQAWVLQGNWAVLQADLRGGRMSEPADTALSLPQ